MAAIGVACGPNADADPSATDSSGGDDDGSTGEDPRALLAWGCSEWDEPPPACEGASALPHGWRAESVDDLAPLAGLTCVRGSLELDNLRGASLQHLESLEVVCGQLKMLGTDVPDLSGLSALEMVGALDIVFNDELTSLAGLSSLREVRGDLIVDSNERLAGLEGLEQVHEPGSLWIERCDLVTSLTPISGITSIGNGLIVRELPNVETIAFPELEFVSHLRVEGNERLREIDIAGLQSAHAVGVMDNPALVSVIGRGELTIVRDAFDDGSGLALQNLPSLVDASAFRSLVEIGATLRFREIGLTDLEDFAAVEGIGERLEIMLNPALPTALAHAFADRFGAMPSKVDGNLGDDVPRDPCPWTDDDECDEEWSDVDVMAGTALCYEDSTDCDHPEPPD